jgi:hypothetical protein
MHGTISSLMGSESSMKRPGEITAIGAYHALFSAVLVGTLVWQGITHHPSDGLVYAAPVIVMLLFVSLIPGCCASGCGSWTTAHASPAWFSRCCT